MCAMTRRKSAMVDRIVDGRHAALIIGQPPEREIVIPLDQLPSGTREGQWLTVVLDGDQLIEVEIDVGATQAARKRIRSKLERLRRRGRRLGG